VWALDDVGDAGAGAGGLGVAGEVSGSPANVSGALSLEMRDSKVE